MTTFLIDLWQDLREKRLWPVAVGLLAATAAVPLVLFKPTSSPPAAPPPSAATPGPRLPVVSVDNGPTEGSKLTQFNPKNPFFALSDSSSSGSGSTSTSTSPAAASSSPSSSSSGSALSKLTHLAGGSSSGGGAPAHTTVTTTTPHWFRYTVDVKFGKPGHLKTVKGVQSLTMFPNAKTPVVVFMGVPTDGTKALFFIDDPSYSAHGKGSCNVSGDACRFVTLTLKNDSETFQSADGQTQYKLRLLGIQKQSFNPSAPTGSSTKPGPKPSPTVHGKLATLDEAQLVPEILSLTGAGADVPSAGSQG
jgi:hypothetical protein